MSNIAIKGATTGTGVFTIESPATNTDRTLTLPDEAGTVLTTTSGVAKAGDTMTGQLIVEASNGAVTVKGASTGAQLRLERTTTNTGHGYLGADDTYALRVYNSAFADGLRVDQSGRVTMPYQPAFKADFAGFATTNTPVSPTSWTVRLNRGSHFNSSNGRFVAPVAGVYSFSGAYLRSSSSAVHRGRFYINGANSWDGELRASEGFSGFNDAGSLTMVLQLNANDYVEWRMSSDVSSSIYSSGYNYFCGYLVG